MSHVTLVVLNAALLMVVVLSARLVANLMDPYALHVKTRHIQMEINHANPVILAVSNAAQSMEAVLSARLGASQMT